MNPWLWFFLFVAFLATFIKAFEILNDWIEDGRYRKRRDRWRKENDIRAFRNRQGDNDQG